MNAIFKELALALQVEFLKIRRSKTLWLDNPGIRSTDDNRRLFMFILKDPERGAAAWINRGEGANLRRHSRLAEFFQSDVFTG